MPSTLAKIIVRHALSATIMAGSVTWLIGRELNGSATSLAPHYVRLFLGLSSIAAFCLGVIGVAGVSAALNKDRKEGRDLNADSTRNEIRSLLLFTIEICIALSVLVFGKFIHF